MTNYNFYWPIYKNLEKEVIELSNVIHFSDDQLKVYSTYIADLLVRCSIEIESISKEIYNRICKKTDSIDKKNLYFDTDCLDLLEKKWNIGKRKVIVSAPYFYFSDKNKIFSSLNKAHRRGDKGSKWKQAYQAVKHDRKNSLEKGSIENLLHAMGALYILNIYYKDEVIKLRNKIDSFDNIAGSDIFSVLSYDATTLTMTSRVGDFIISDEKVNLDEYVYIIRYDDDTVENMCTNFRKDAEISRKRFDQSVEVCNYLKSNPNYKIESIEKTCCDMGREDLIEEFKCWQNSLKFNNCRYEVILNKNEKIYPKL